MACSTSPGVHNPRRHALLKSYAAGAAQDFELQMFWWAKQIERIGAVLPPGFPSKDALARARYTTQEDLDGATASELQINAGLSRKDALTVLRTVASF